MKNFEDHIDAVKRLCETHNLDSLYLFDPNESSESIPTEDISKIHFKNIKLGGFYEHYAVFKNELNTLILDDRKNHKSSALLIQSIDDMDL